MTARIIFSIFIILISTFNVNAQSIEHVKNPPVISEALIGSRGFSFQFVSDKKFQNIPKLGYYFVSNFQTDWGETKIDDYMLQGLLPTPSLKVLMQKLVFSGIL